MGVAIVTQKMRLPSGLLMSILATVSFAADENNPLLITMQTTYGEIQIELYPDKAPVSASNFLRYVDGGHYDGSSFYRTVRYGNDNGNPKIEVIQGGRGDAEAPFDAIAHETTEQTGILHTDGVISMARGDIGTASSEFFICIRTRRPCPQTISYDMLMAVIMKAVRFTERCATATTTAIQKSKSSRVGGATPKRRSVQCNCRWNRSPGNQGVRYPAIEFKET